MSRYLMLLSTAILISSCQLRLGERVYQFERWRAGLSQSQLQLGDFQVPYLIGGHGEVLMLVHGFGANKDTWTRFAQHLTNYYQVIAVDLPGFGDSSRIEGERYDIESQAQRLEQIREQLGIDHMHLVGNSMGSMVVTAYAKAYPERTKSMTFMNAGGIQSPIPSDHQKRLAEGENVLLVGSRDDFVRLINYTFTSPPYIPRPILNEFYQRSVENLDWNQHILEQIGKFPGMMERILPDTRAPLLVFWGDEDRITHVSATDLIKQYRPDARIEILSECGHAPMLEKPEETAAIFINFLKSLNAEPNQTIPG